MMTQTTAISSITPSRSAPAAASAARQQAAPGRNAGFRVLMVVESAAAGTGRHVMDLAQTLVDWGCDVHVLHNTIRLDAQFTDRLKQLAAVHCQGHAMRTAPHSSDGKLVLKIRRYLKDYGPFDVIHGHSSKGGALARLAALGSGVPVFYTPHGLVMMDPKLSIIKRTFYGMIEWGLSRWTAGVIAVAPEEARAARAWGMGGKRIMTIPNGVGAPNMTPRDQARREIGAEENECVIGFVGRMVEQKAPDVLVRAFARASECLPHLRLAMVGAGPMDAALRRLAREVGVDDRIIWLGERDARQVMAGFDLFAIASRKEGLPYVILEAMSIGLPVVATDRSGVEILIDPGTTGEVVATDDEAALADALMRVAGDPARLARQSAASITKAGEFTIEIMAAKTLEAYRSAGVKERAL